jgi:hypothetical protein
MHEQDLTFANQRPHDDLNHGRDCGTTPDKNVRDSLGKGWLSGSGSGS